MPQRDLIDPESRGVLEELLERVPGGFNSIPDIAETLGVSTNSVKTHLQRGLRSMAQTLETKQ